MTLVELKKITFPACKEFAVKKLDVFGSLAKGKHETGSDVDLLVEFEAPDRMLSKRYFGLLHYLEDTLGCDVDLLTINSLKNPYLRRSALSHRITIYEG